MSDAFVAFFVGLLAGGCIGMIILGFAVVARQSDDRREEEFELAHYRQIRNIIHAWGVDYYGLISKEELADRILETFERGTKE